MAAKTAFSDRGLPHGGAVDTAALSDYAAAKPIAFAVPVGSQPVSANSAYLVINTSTDHVLGPVGVAGRIVKIDVTSARAASVGTGSLSVYKATDGSTKTLITNTIDPETFTANVPKSFTMLTTGVATVAAGDVLFLRGTADNNTVTTDLSSVRVVAWIVPTDTTPTRGSTTWGS